MELEILKIYIKTHFKTGFIQRFKSFGDVSILFDKKQNGSFRLCIDYQGLNNFTIKNWYLVPFIDEVLDQLSRGKQFI